VRYNESFVFPRSESSTRQRGPVIILAGASGFQGRCLGDIKSNAPGLGPHGFVKLLTGVRFIGYNED
jgi:hypothetical protein